MTFRVVRDDDVGLPPGSLHTYYERAARKVARRLAQLASSWCWRHVSVSPPPTLDKTGTWWVNVWPRRWVPEALISRAAMAASRRISAGAEAAGVPPRHVTILSRCTGPARREHIIGVRR